MTNEEAIYQLGWLTAATNDPKDLEAIRMAIEALREKSQDCMWVCPNCGLDVHVDYDKCVRCGERREP